MLPVTHTESPQEAAQRQANFIVLRSLESKLSPQLFQEVVDSISRTQDLPRRIDWKGEQKPLSFEEVKLNFSHVDQNYLPQLLQNVGDGNNQTTSKDVQSQNLKIQSIQKVLPECGMHENLLLKRRCLHLQNYAADQKWNLKYYQVSRYERMKTIFGHALIAEGYNAPIYNVMFDQTGSFIFSGADDGIIKIWDKDTMNLQASLHSHNDVITDMDISKCNNYLATSSKDGKLIIWDWKTCQKIDEIAAHNSTINNIKFFQVKIKSQNAQQKEVDKIQILVTCSDDGTIKIYDEATYTNLQSSQNNESAGKRSSRHNQTQQKKERYCLCLTPEEYRPGPGSRNKKIDSVNVSQSGLVAAGTNSGEVFMWKLDLHKIKQQQQKAFQWLGSSKKHMKSVHFCEFSPNGRFLFTGSIDGTAKVWNVENEKLKKGQDQVFGLTDNRLMTTLQEKRLFNEKDKNLAANNRNGDLVNFAEQRASKNSWQCDSIAWSCYGRYAIASISGKVDVNDKNEEWSILKVWDSYTDTTIQDLGKENGLQLMTFSFVIAAHPKYEEIFLSGSMGGTICLWNIKTRKLIKKFLEYGVYSYEKYTMSDPFDGKFSPDGSCFVVGSEMGTLSLFSNELAKYKYDGTRVEQFFMKDNEKHLLNIYYDGEEEPQQCGYNLIPYEAQPPAPLISKFKNTRPMTNQEYERSLAVRQGLAMEEEAFIGNQLQEGLRNDLFNRENDRGQFLEEDAYMNDQYEEEKEIPVRRNQRPRIGSQLSQINGGANNHDASQEDVDLLNRMNDAERQVRQGRGRRMNIVNRVNQRINAIADQDISFDDHASDENFEIQEDQAESEEQEDEDYGDDQSEDVRTTRRLQRNDRGNRDNIGRQQNSRAQRAQRRQNRYQEDESDEEEEQKGGRRSRRKVVLKSDDESENDISEDEDFDMSEEIDQPRRRLQRNNRRVQDSESEAEDESDGDDVSEYGIRTRHARNERKQKKKKESKSSRRNLRDRGTRKNYQGMDSSEDDFMDFEEEKIENPSSKRKQSQEEKPGSQGKKGKRVIQDEESETDMIDHDVIVPSDNKKQKGEEDFELLVEDNAIPLEEDMIQNVERSCGFCLRIDPPLTGPFVRVIKTKPNQPDERYYFHKDCIEVNDFSFFSKQKQKWLNIGKALERFRKNSSMCSRCNHVGATIKCSSCYKYYHGFLCSQLDMIYTGTVYQCFECRNKDNHRTLKDIQQLFEKHELKQIKRNINKSHLLANKQNKTQYIPQVNDLIYYFFQGHEKFISYYNCFFYSGDSEELQLVYPWKLYDVLEKPTLCRVKSITYFFPTKNVLYLIKKFGRASNIVQTPQVVTHLKLSIEGMPDAEFDLDFFPNDLGDFMILKNLYENSQMAYGNLLTENKVLGQTFKARLRQFNQVKVIGIQEKEPTLYDQTGWETILHKQVDQYRLRERGRRGQHRDNDEQEPAQIMNFWELILNEDGEDTVEYLGLINAFDGSQVQTIIGIIQDYCERKKEQTAPFIERVTDNIASDYREHICAEMYLSLIQERMLNSYYRSVEQFFADLDQIYTNALTYNGAMNDLTKFAKKLSDNIKNEVKKSINYIEDSKRRRYEETKTQPVPILNSKPVGKLTAPPPSKVSLNVSTMDAFRQQLRNDKKGGTLEEVKQEHQTNGRTTRRNKDIFEIYQQQANYNDYEAKQEVSDSEFKNTPIQKNTFSNQMIQDSSSGSRRATRNQNNLIQIKNENYEPPFTHQFSTGEKTAKIDEENQGETALGKRTRSGRQTRLMRQNLNEEDDDKEFEKLIDEDGRIIPTMSGRRIRQH